MTPIYTADSLHPAFDDCNVAICCTINDAYTEYCAVLLQSIIAHSSARYNYDMVVLGSELSEKSQKKLLSILSLHPHRHNISIRLHDTGKLMTDRGFEPKSGPAATCQRLFLPDILPAYEKAVFIDVDTIVVGDIAELYYTDMGDNWIACCRDMGMIGVVGVKSSKIEYIEKVTGKRDISKYVNTGVMLANLKAWREHQVTAKSIHYIETRKEIQWPDQDALNNVCQDHIHYLDLRWNVLAPDFFSPYLTGNEASLQAEAQANAKVIHYITSRKPWVTPERELAEHWWSIARTLPFYEEIIYRNLNRRVQDEAGKWRKELDTSAKKQISTQAQLELKLSKAQNELAKLQKEQRAHREASAAMLREVVLLPLTWLNLQRCRVAQHLTFGKAHERYKRKKKRLRERVMKALRFLTES